jgi:thiol-disulfide isomerase/thioredoxin
MFRYAVTVAVFALMGTPAFSQEVFRWETDLAVAKQHAADTDRLVLIHLGAPWCVPCQNLERTVFNRPGFGAALVPDYVCVKLNADYHPGLSKTYGVKTIPADVVITPTGALVQVTNSPPTITQYTSLLTRTAQNARTRGVLVTRSRPATVLAKAPVAESPPVFERPRISAVANPAFMGEFEGLAAGILAMHSGLRPRLCPPGRHPCLTPPLHPRQRLHPRRGRAAFA